MPKQTEKLSKFSKILSQLRKERGISQKKAATDLGISQALLSHYEKGIRECGLDFVIKCSEYYHVTTDYLLGVSESRNGSPVIFSADGTEESSFATLSLATRHLLDTAIAAASDEKTQQLAHDYYLLNLYRGALTLAKAGVLPKELFSLDYSLARELAGAALAVQDVKIALLDDRSRSGMDGTENAAVKALIAEAEAFIAENFILE